MLPHSISRNFFRSFLLWASEFFAHMGYTKLSSCTRAGLLRHCGVSLGANAWVEPGFNFRVDGIPMQIGEYTLIGMHNHFWNLGHITIGKFTMFGPNVILVGGGHDRNTYEPNGGALIIGNGCWIGCGAKIIRPITVGNNAIIAGGAVVIHDVPENAIVAGVPARVVGYRDLLAKVWHYNNVWYCPKTHCLVEK